MDFDLFFYMPIDHFEISTSLLSQAFDVCQNPIPAPAHPIPAPRSSSGSTKDPNAALQRSLMIL